MFPALAGGFFTTGPPEKSHLVKCFFFFLPSCCKLCFYLFFFNLYFLLTDNCFTEFLLFSVKLSGKVFVVVQLLSMSNSLRPHGLQPARLFCPWDFLGKNIGMEYHFLLQRIFLTQVSNPHLLHCRQILYCYTTREAQSLCFSLVKDNFVRQRILNT